MQTIGKMIALLLYSNNRNILTKFIMFYL